MTLGHRKSKLNWDCNDYNELKHLFCTLMAKIEEETERFSIYAYKTTYMMYLS